MGLASDFNALCPLFDFNNSGGVLFPYFMTVSDTALNNRIDLDHANLSLCFGKAKFGWDVRLVTVEAFACSDGAAVKSATATAEAVISFRYGSSVTTIDDGTEFAVITCDGSGPVGKRWGGTTTATTISSGQEIAVFLKQAAATSSTSTCQDGAAQVVLWFAVVNAP